MCERLKAAYPDIPVIMITSVFHIAQARREGFAAGADASFLDPVEPERLIDAVARFLDPSRRPSMTESPTLITDDYGTIISANAVSARWLNMSARGVRDRTILAFFGPGRDRIA